MKRLSQTQEEEKKTKRMKRKRELNEQEKKERNEEKIFVRYDYIFCIYLQVILKNQDQNRSQNVFCPDEDDADDRCVDCNGIGV